MKDDKMIRFSDGNFVDWYQECNHLQKDMYKVLGQLSNLVFTVDTAAKKVIQYNIERLIKVLEKNYPEYYKGKIGVIDPDTGIPSEAPHESGL